jgi:hypothetical protein
MEHTVAETKRAPSPDPAHSGDWPSLPFEAWRDTHSTLHLWLQIVGKIRLAQAPWVNHSWHVSLRVTARGLSTLAMPHGTRALQIDFDFIGHQLIVHSTDGKRGSMALEPKSVATFYRELMALLRELELPVTITREPSELRDPIPFAQDEQHRSYNPEYANRFWRVLLQAERVLDIFRARFWGKSSPVHFFWGNADLALTRFSGRRAPEHPGGRPHLPDWVLRDAYSHECFECGFWPGEAENPQPVFYCLAYPEPDGFRTAKIKPRGAHYSEALKEIVLPYDAVRLAPSPDATVLEFLQSAYEAAAQLGGWDRSALDYPLSALKGEL